MAHVRARIALATARAEAVVIPDVHIGLERVAVPAAACVVSSFVSVWAGADGQAVMARCARGDHEVQKKYGPCGIITAVLLFPIGLICLL